MEHKKQLTETQMDYVIKTFQEVGFANLNKNAIKRLYDHFESSNRKLVMVMSHTAHQDFFLGLLLFRAMRIPITMFTSFKNPLLTMWSKYMGMVTRQKNESNTEAILNHLRDKREFALLLSLGRTEPNPTMHSGYFYIAQALQVPIIVLGFDYFLQTGYVSQQRWLPMATISYTEFQKKEEVEILHEIQNIWPVKPTFQVGFDPITYHTQGIKHIPDLPQCPILLHKVMTCCYPIESVVLIVAIATVLLFFLFLFMALFKKKKTKH